MFKKVINIENNTLTDKGLTDYLRKNNNKQVLVEMKLANRRSLKQNNFYWGTLIKTMSEETGYFPNECHQILAKEFLRYEKNGMEFVRSTTELNTEEFNKYIEAVDLYIQINILS